MDERTAEAAQSYTQRTTDEAAQRQGSQVLTHVIFAKGKFEHEPLIVTSRNSQDRMDQMARAGIPSNSNWASGHKTNQGSISACGPWIEGRKKVEAYLRKR